MELLSLQHSKPPPSTPAGGFRGFRGGGMVSFPNPDPREVDNRDDVGDIWHAARAAGVKPGTIRVWIHRQKVEPFLAGDGGPEVFHIPTIIRAAQVRPGRPQAAA